MSKSKNKKKWNRNNKHHCYPKKDSRHNREIKVINAEVHRRWHLLVDDMTPKQAVRFIAKNFMPTDIEHLLLSAIRGTRDPLSISKITKWK